MEKRGIDGTAWALLFNRWILGLMFLMPGFFKVFTEGPVRFAREAFVEGFQETWIPLWLLWGLGLLFPFLELAAGLLVCLGWRVKEGLVVLGSILVIVTYGHLLEDPFLDMSGDIFPLLVLVVFLLMVPRDRDLLSVEGWLRRGFHPSESGS